MTRKVTVVDYGVGNVHSVLKALREAGADAVLTTSAAAVRSAERLLVPGVGAFPTNVQALHDRGLWDAVFDFAKLERPMMGICLGMQMLMESSEEFGLHDGLGVFRGTVKALRPEAGIKIPHTGWNRIWPRPAGNWQGTALEQLEPGVSVYFVHSFTCVPDDEEVRLADAHYGTQRIAAAIRRGHVWGCQFHPEKSGPVGIEILKRFSLAD